MDLREAYAIVSEGRAYQKEHFPRMHEGKAVGRFPAVTWDQALDILLAHLGEQFDGYGGASDG